MPIRHLTLALVAILTLAAPMVAEAGPKHCPPGLAKKAVPCVPPGLAKKHVYRDDDDHDRDRHRHTYRYDRDRHAYDRHDGDRYDHRHDYDDHHWRVGDRLPRDVRYIVIDDYDRYGLPYPDRGSRYVMIDNDIFRVAIETARILEAVRVIGQILN